MASERLTRWLGEHRVDGRLVARIGRRGDELVAEFAGVGTLAAANRGTRTRFEPVEGADPSVIEKVSASVLDALVRHAQGKVTLHGSAVCKESSVVALVGASGAGKSTLAAALCAQSNIDLVADDTVALELSDEMNTRAPVEVTPTQTAAWLLSDARSALGLDSGPREKIAVEIRRTSERALFLTAVVALVFDSQASLATMRRLHGHDAFTVLADSAFRFVIDEPSAQEREFEQFRSLVRHCAVFELRRPRDLGGLARSVACVEALFERSVGGTS